MAALTSRGFDEEVFSTIERSACGGQVAAFVDRHYGHGHLWRDRRLQRLARYRVVRQEAAGVVQAVFEVARGRPVPRHLRARLRRTRSACLHALLCGVAADGAGLLGVGHIAIDGKTLCGSASAKLGPLHLVSAWATEAKLTLGEVAVDGKSNEITAIPKLLELLDLKGALVTIDAMGCQKTIAQQIVAKGGDYLLAVKGNQDHLLEDIQATMEKALDGQRVQSP